MLAHLPTIALLSTALIIIAMCFARAIAKVPERPELVVYGDVAWLPREAVAPGNSRGGSSGWPSTTVTRTEGTSVTHSGGASR